MNASSSTMAWRSGPIPRGLRRIETGLRRRGRNHPGLDLAVTVRAHEHTLSRLRAIGIERLAARHGDSKGLLRRVDMMEVQVEDAPFIAADRAAASRFGDEDPLDLLMTSRDRLADAAFATPPLA